MISEVLLPKLRVRFPSRNLRTDKPPCPFAIFPEIHSEVGNVEIYDDGDELTVVVGNFTHTHFSNYDDNLSKEQKAEIIAEGLCKFLEDLFADRIIMWGSHRGLGGHYRRDCTDLSIPIEINHTKFVWSGPLER